MCRTAICFILEEKWREVARIQNSQKRSSEKLEAVQWLTRDFGPHSPQAKSGEFLDRSLSDGQKTRAFGSITFRWSDKKNIIRFQSMR